MIQSLYRGTVREFVERAEAGTLPGTLEDAAAGEGNAIGTEEFKSWVLSLWAFARVLASRADLLDSGVFVEFLMPLSAKRCDILLSGRNRVGEPTAVIVELKQWSQVQAGPYREHVRIGEHVRLHPSEQVKRYVTHLRHFHSAFHRSELNAVKLLGCAWLHNLRSVPSLALLRDRGQFGPVLDDYRVFGADDAGELANFLVAALLPGPAEPTTAAILAGRAAPSAKLLDLVVATIEQRHEWNLLDEQRTVYWAVRDAVQKAKDIGEKRVVLVRGGPGTGKSVLAIQLLADAARQGWKVVHATGSKAFQTVLQAQTLEIANPMLKQMFGARYKRELPVQDLFTTFAEVARSSDGGRRDRIDLMVGDEAHRLWEHRRLKYPNGKVKWLTEAPMVREVIDASLVSVFFLDDNQAVRRGEIGHSTLIESHAQAMGICVTRFDLDAQFRCAGSDSYLRWVEGLFGYRQDNDLDWRSVGNYECSVSRDAAEVAEQLRMHRAMGFKCRMLAGYCWRWSKPTGIGELPHDLSDPRFGGWTGAWIEKTGKDLEPEQHQYFLWATRDTHAEQVGSIYSVQGFEFDYVGVIWGDDLVWRDGRWVAQLDKNKDGTFKKELGKDGDAVKMLKQVYRVLLTRGMRGTKLTILDGETRAYVEGRLREYAIRRVG